MWIAFFNWWAFSLGTFWFAACLCVWPWQRTQPNHFDLTNLARKIRISLLLALVQGAVFWFFITLASRGAPVLLDLVMLSLAINGAIAMVARYTVARAEDEWEELTWIAQVQFCLWVLAGLAFLILR